MTAALLMTWLTLAADALVLASIADAVTTRWGIAGGQLFEANPLMRWATRTLPRALAVKAVALVVIGWQVAQLRVAHPTLALGIVWGAALFSGWLAWRNFRLRQRLLAGL